MSAVAGASPASGDQKKDAQEKDSQKKDAGAQVRPQGRRRAPLIIGLVLAILGALAVAAGITAATAFQVASTATSSGELGGSRAAVTAPGLLEVRDGAATVEVRGKGEVTLATARSADLDAWLRADPPVEAATLDGVAAGGERLSVDGVNAAAAAEVPDAAASDLWLTSETGDGSATLEVPRGRQPVQVVATAPDGGLQELTMSWPDEATSPWALPLLIGGGVVLLLGVALMVLGRRGSAGTAEVPAVPAAEPAGGGSTASPARPRRSAQRVAALPLLGSLVLAGCASAEPLTLEPRKETGSAPVLTDGQLERVLEGKGGVVPTVEAADASLDEDLAARRLGGAPLQARAAAYLAATSVREAEGGDPDAPPPVRPLGGERKLAALPEAGEWPRYAVIATQPDADAGAQADLQTGPQPEAEPDAEVESGEGEGPVAPSAQPVPVLEVLEQATPRESWKVVARANLLPGQAFPALTAEGGTVEPVALDGGGLVSPPQQVIADLADVLTLGPASDRAEGFGDSAFINTVLTEQVQQEEGSGKFVDYAVTHTPREGQTWALRTADGGAVVIAVIDSVQTLAPNTEGSTLTLTPTLAAIAGAPTATSQELTTAETVVVTVPAGGGAPAVPEDRVLDIVGGERDVTAVKVG